MSVKTESIFSTLAAILLFVAAFWLGPLQFSDYFQKIPGDLGDARLNAYFLENIYQYVLGNSESLWHFGFYYPFPYVLGFSDNLFGLSPLFMLFRVLGVDAYSAFNYWFMSGYLLNYVACLYAFRKMGLSSWSACLGSLVFTFGLPVTGHAGHAQLHHRFAIPIVTYLFIEFIKTKDLKILLQTYFWLVWQFFIGVYIGFFAAVLLMAMTFCFLLFPYVRQKTALGDVWQELVGKVKALPRSSVIKLVLGFVLLSLAMVWLFYPYLQVKSLYGFTRSWSEVKGMLPRIYSYIFAPSSTLWNFNFELFHKLPMRWEHQMFPGMVPFVLGVLGMIVGFCRSSTLTFKLIACGFLFLFAITLYTGSAWWEYFYYLPLFSAIRAVTRIDMLYLMFYGFLAGYLLDLGFKRKPVLISLALLFSALFAYESGQMKTNWNTMSRWVLKENELTAMLPKDRPKDAVLFFAQMSKPEYEHEVTSMWLGLKHGFKVINGYSGNVPQGYNNHYWQDCAELGRRLQIYDKFAKDNDLELLTAEQRSKILPVGFKSCP